MSEKSEKKDDPVADDGRTPGAAHELVDEGGVDQGGDGEVRPSGAAGVDQGGDGEVPGGAAGADQGGEPTEQVTAAEEVPGATRLRLRRAPRYRSFGLTGTILGVVAGVVLALSFTAASNYSMQTIAGYFAAIFGLIGAVAGLGLAVLIERRRS